MIVWTGFAPGEFRFDFSGSVTSTFLEQSYKFRVRATPGQPYPSSGRPLLSIWGLGIHEKVSDRQTGAELSGVRQTGVRQTGVKDRPVQGCSWRAADTNEKRRLGELVGGERDFFITHSQA